MKKRTPFRHIIEETLPSQRPPSPAPKKQAHTSPARRMLRDMLNLHPIRYEGTCWPSAVIRKK